MLLPHSSGNERYAKQGLLEFINVLERDPSRRTNVDFLVTESPLSTIMYSYTTLERVPGQYVRYAIDRHARKQSTSGSA